MAYKLGLDAKIFHGAAGQTASTEMTNVTDVTLNLETGEADITTRAAEGWRITAATLKEASVEFEMIWDTEDSGFNAIQSAYFGTRHCPYSSPTVKAMVLTQTSSLLRSLVQNPLKRP